MISLASKSSILNGFAKSRSMLAGNSAFIPITYFMAYLADTSNTNLVGITTDSSKNIYIGGTSRNSSGIYNSIFAKYNSSGVIQWQRTFGNSSYTTSKGSTIDSSGNFYAGGILFNSSNGYNAFIVKYNSSGTLQWQRSLADPNAAASQNDYVNAIATDSSNNIYVTGEYSNTNYGGTAFIVKYNSSGTIQWQRSLAGPQSLGTQADFGLGITTDSSSNVYVTGQFANSSNGYNAFIVKYNSSGTLQWQRSLADSLSGNQQGDIGYAITTDFSNNVYVTGRFSNSSTGYNIFIIKYNSSGTLQWQRSLADPNAAASQSDYGQAISTDSSGNLYVSGYYKNSSSKTTAFIVKYNSSGTLQWQRSLNGTTYPNALSFGLTVDSSGIVYAVGEFLNSSNFYNGFIIKIPNDGSKTGTYVIDSTHTLVYASSSLTDSSGSLTDASGSLTDSSGVLTDSAGSLTDASGSLTTVTETI